MTGVLELARPEIRDLHAYQPAKYASGMVRLNANETAWPPPGDTSSPGLNRYPEARPIELTNALARHFGVKPDRLIATRGSSEAIDLLIRCFCAAYADDVVICPPTFGMYRVYAQVQAAGVRELPLCAEKGYSLDVGSIEATWDARCKLLFLCSPNNPTGNTVDAEDIDRLCATLKGRGVIVVDAAYAEFSSQTDLPALLEQHDNLVVLRTLSKALGVAGARCGAAIADPTVVELLGRILPPYCFSTPSQRAVLASLSDRLANQFDERIALLRAERSRVAERLSSMDKVRRVWPSEANFLLVEVADPERFDAAAKAGKVLIRDFSKEPYTIDCFRITIGTEAENEQLLTALE